MMKRVVKPVLMAAGSITVSYLFVIRSVWSLAGEPESWTTAIMISAVVVFVAMILISIMTLKATPYIGILKASGQAGETCDPNILLQEVDKALFKAKTDKYNTELFIYKAQALIYLGRLEEARALLSGINIRSNDDGSSSNCVYLDCMIDLEIQSGRLDNAYQYYQQMVQDIHTIETATHAKDKVTKDDEGNINVMHAAARFAQARIFLHSRNPEHIQQAESLLSDSFAALASKDSKVLLALARGKLYLRQGRMAQARQELQLVIDNGNAMSARGEAQSILMSLPAVY